MHLQSWFMSVLCKRHGVPMVSLPSPCSLPLFLLILDDWRYEELWVDDVDTQEDDGPSPAITQEDQSPMIYVHENSCPFLRQDHDGYSRHINQENYWNVSLRQPTYECYRNPQPEMEVQIKQSKCNIKLLFSLPTRNSHPRFSTSKLWPREGMGDL